MIRFGVSLTPIVVFRLGFVFLKNLLKLGQKKNGKKQLFEQQQKSFSVLTVRFLQRRITESERDGVEGME